MRPCSPSTHGWPAYPSGADGDDRALPADRPRPRPRRAGGERRPAGADDPAHRRGPALGGLNFLCRAREPERACRSDSSVSVEGHLAPSRADRCDRTSTFDSRLSCCSGENFCLVPICRSFGSLQSVVTAGQVHPRPAPNTGNATAKCRLMQLRVLRDSRASRSNEVTRFKGTFNIRAALPAVSRV
jgi:hypothetical protein